MRPNICIRLLLACLAGWPTLLTPRVLADGSVIGWGDNYNGQATPPAGDDFVAIAVGYEGYNGDDYSLALKADGSIIGWGDNDYGRATPPAGNDFVAIAAGGYHGLALKADGSIVAWGNEGDGACNVPDGNDFVAIAAGLYHSLALRADGSIEAWGYARDGQCDVPDGNDFVAIAASQRHSLALRADGSLVAWGRNDQGQRDVPDGNEFVAIAAGGYHCLALKADGSIVAWGNEGDGACNVPDGNDFVAIAAGLYHSLALRTNGSIAAWGYDADGQVSAPAGNEFVAIAAGGYHNLALQLAAITLRPAQNSLQATESMTVEVILPEGAIDSEPVTVQVVNQTPAVVSLSGAVDNMVSLQYPVGGPRVQQLSVTGIAAGEARLSASASGFPAGAATFVVWTQGPTLHVDAGAAGDNTGSSWENACTDLQAALDAARAATGVLVEIWVAAGTSRPSMLTDPFSSDSRRATFQLLNGVALYGGFPPGGGEWETRDVALHETILSGDIGVPGDDTDNCYNVVRGNGTDATAILDGFTIREGRAVEWHQGMDVFITLGGGMLIQEGSPTVASCTFTDNVADHGAALYVHTSGRPRVSDCRFVQNTAIRHGGAVSVYVASPMFQRCVLSGNAAGIDGGAANFTDATAVLENCIISGNVARRRDAHGGGVCRGTLINCVLKGNSGPHGGGTWRSTLYNCTLVANAAAVRGGGADSSELYNCIVYGNRAPSGQDQYGSTLDHCWTSEPRFVDYVAGDLHLQSDSPCIDAGENAYVTSATDLDGNPRIDEGTVDIGAYELVPEPPAIARQPGHWALKEGGPGRIRLAVSGHPTPQIQWYCNGTPVPDGNNTFLEFPAVTRDLEGLYWIFASNALGEITSEAIVLLVSNVEPMRFPAWEWTSEGGATTVEMAPTPFGPWVEGCLLPAGTTSGLYVETDLAEPTCFYRLQGNANARFTATGRIPGWWYPEAEGAVHVIEYAWSGNGWGNWVELTELTLPASPHLFLDTEAFDHPGAVYRSTPKAP